MAAAQMHAQGRLFQQVSDKTDSEGRMAPGKDEVFMSPEIMHDHTNDMTMPYNGTIAELYNLYRQNKSHDAAVEAVRDHIKSTLDKDNFRAKQLPPNTSDEDLEKFLAKTPMS